ncbi:hypothetical protein K431DRAFT_289615 [Polychaeton citri CBS 116435]|uniref:ABM domain-containing protein n=1 Tax=Polychaeton citri CBS 116435 TaxID=1314669 RepID=A0A9P4PYL4_9PEZI|nr:hypothetical protein K431DRAFT_289615 [Polychaeton citri CBS 116435]
MPTTEMAILPLIAGTNPGDPSDQSSAVLRDCFGTLAQQDGLQEIHFGTWIESADSLQLFINWDDIDKHKAFMDRDIYEAFNKRFGTIMSGKPTIFHVDFKSPEALAAVLAATVTEVFTIYYDSAEVPPKSIDGLVEFCRRAKEAAPPGLADCTFGKSYEKLTYQDAKCQVIVGVIGWSSVQAHMDFRQTRALKDALPFLMEGMKRIEMHHVSAMSYVSG